MRPFATMCVAALLAVAAAGCSKPVDLKQSVRLTDVSSGWFDAGVTNGQNKLVPSITFRIARNPGTDLSALALNVAFRFTGDEDSSEDVYVQRVDFAGDSTAPITVRSNFGFTGEQPRAEMLTHSQFRDMEARVFAKQNSSQWIALGDIKVVRQLITH